ncbi:hypothetical protein V8F06_007543 [Rhypophila decipiens]
MFTLGPSACKNLVASWCTFPPSNPTTDNTQSDSSTHFKQTISLTLGLPRDSTGTLEGVGDKKSFMHGLEPASVMDHAERLSQNLEALGVDSLGSLSLQELMQRIDDRLPCSNLSTRRLLHIFFSWLNERLTIIDNSDEDVVRNEIQTCVDCLRTCHIPDIVMAENFKIWESEHVKIDPLSARRLGLAWVELQEVLTLDRRPEHSTQAQGNQFTSEENVELSQFPDGHDPNHAPEPTCHQEDIDMAEDHRGDMPPDRCRQSGQEGDVDVDDDHWGGMHPDRFKKSLLDPIIEEEQESEDNLSFLTGANHLVYLEQMKHAPPSAIIKNPVVRNAERREARKEARKQELEQFIASEPHRQEQSLDLRKGQKGGKWQCRRCGSKGIVLNGDRISLNCSQASHVTGHPSEKCPTELDPKYDVPPVKKKKSYTCVYCGSGDHYANFCRRNPLPDSVNQRRIRAGIWEDLTVSPTPHGSERDGRLGDYERDSDGKSATDSSRDYDRDYDRDYERDHDYHSPDHKGRHGYHERDHDRDRGRHERDNYKDYDMAYDRDHNRNQDKRDWDHAEVDKDSDRREERRHQQRSRNVEEPRANRGSNRRRSPSPKSRRHRNDRPRIDRYRSGKQVSHTNSRRSRSPERRDLRTSSRRSRSPEKRDLRRPSKRSRSPDKNDPRTSSRWLRSPIEDRPHTVSPGEERDLVPEVRGPDRIDYGEEADEPEGTCQGLELRDLSIRTRPLIHPSRSILIQQRKISGVLSYSDNPDTSAEDVTMTGSTHWIPSDSGFTPEEFRAALDEFIREIADEALPRGDMDEEWFMGPVEDPNAIAQWSEDIQPVTPLTTTMDWSGIRITRQNQSGDVLSESLSAMSIHKSSSAEREKSPPLELGVSVKPKPDNSESQYDLQIWSLIMRVNRENIWLHKAQRSRARDLLAAKKDVDDGAVSNVEVTFPASAEDSFMAEDVDFGDPGVNVSAPIEDPGKTEVSISGEPKANLPAQNEGLVMATVVHQQQGIEEPPATDDQVMTDALIAPEQKLSQLADEITENIRALEDTQPPDELSVSVEESSYISMATEDSSMTELGDQLMGEVDMLDRNAAHD